MPRPDRPPVSSSIHSTGLSRGAHEHELLERSTGSFAIGEDVYRAKLAADEMIDVPLDDLLAIAEADLRRNQTAFAETARRIDPGRPAGEVLKALESDHPPAGKLLAATQAELDALARFMTDQRTLPPVPLREELSVRHPQGVRRGDQQ